MKTKRKRCQICEKMFPKEMFTGELRKLGRLYMAICVECLLVQIAVSKENSLYSLVEVHMN